MPSASQIAAYRRSFLGPGSFCLTLFFQNIQFMIVSLPDEPCMSPSPCSIPKTFPMSVQGYFSFLSFLKQVHQIPAAHPMINTSKLPIWDQERSMIFTVLSFPKTPSLETFKRPTYF